MSKPRRSDSQILVAAGVLALALPFIGSRIVEARLRNDVEPHLSDALGESVSIGGVEATLTGAVHLREVTLGGVFTAASIEASVGLDSMFRGRLAPDEIRIDSPRLRTRVDRSGEQKLRRIVQRAADARRASATDGAANPRRLRRIIVTGGDLRVDLEGRGVLRIHDVELHPQAGGVRLVSGTVDVDLLDHELAVRGRFGRIGADVELPALGLRRALAVDGVIELRGPRVGQVSLSNAIASAGVTAPHRFELVADVDSADPNSNLTVRIEPEWLEIDGEGMPLAPLAALAPRWLRLRDATASGTARFVRDGDAILANLDLEAEGVWVDHARVANEPLPLAGHTRAVARVSRADDGVAIRLDDLAFTTEGVRATVTGTLAGVTPAGLPRRMNLRVELPRTPCMRALRTIPEPARRRLAGLSARGDMSAHLEIAYDRAESDATRLAVDVDMSDCKVAREATAADPRTLRKPFEHTFPDGSTATVGPGRPGYARYAEIPAVVARSFVAAEDARFFDHAGFDPRQIRASLAIDISEQKLVRGGSTITQQLAKNVFLDPRRTFARKLEEAVLAWRLESRLRKRDILETYLNIIELGDGVFGVRDAARYWFARELHQLRPREVAFLAALTPAPRTLSRRVRASGKVDPETRERVEIVLRHMRDAGAITHAAWARESNAPIAIRAPLLSLHAEE